SISSYACIATRAFLLRTMFHQDFDIGRPPVNAIMQLTTHLSSDSRHHLMGCSRCIAPPVELPATTFIPWDTKRRRTRAKLRQRRIILVLGQGLIHGTLQLIQQPILCISPTSSLTVSLF